MNSKGILESLISEDYELAGSGRWLYTTEHDSLVIDSEKQIFYWNSRDIVGNAYTWLTEVKNMKYSEAIRLLKSYGEYHGEFIHVVKGKQEKDVVVYPALVDIFWTNGLNNRDYWYRRALTDETINRYKLGAYSDYYTIPFYQDGIFKDFQCRKDIPTKKIWHWYKHVGPLLFNSDILTYTDKVFLVEAPTSAMAMNQLGLMTISHNGGAEDWDIRWFKYFAYQKEIYILYDNDSAGRFGAIKVAKQLGEYRTKIYNFDKFSEHYDAGDFVKEGGTTSELLTLVNNESKYIFELKEEKRNGRSNS